MMTTSIPQPPGIPLWGNILDVDPSNTWTSLQKLWEKYGEIFKITQYAIRSAFANSSVALYEIRYAVHNSLFSAFDDEASWGVHHRILAPLITPAAVADRFIQVRDCASELTAKWRALSGDSSVSAIGQLNRPDLETTTLCFYGRKLNGLTGPEPPMINAMNGATSEAIKRPTRPRLVNWLFYQSKFEKDTKAMRQYAAECLDYRKPNPADRKDMLYSMMNDKDPETGQALSEQEIIDEIVTTPIGSKSRVCYESPRRDGSVIGDGEFTHDHLESLPYCAGIVRESLRLSAAAPGFNIEPLPDAQGPILLGGGKYHVPAKQTLIIVLHGVNRDPTVFERPETFKSERMVGEAFEKLPEGSKKWFGNGRRDGWFNLRPVDFYIKVKPRAK
ncbi:hypothetical protein HO173_008347 [Letharia columbiana]|uniref:Cytochrome P450 n=1 Tax=Letharia columbiana TaxID=112416 RepID=A0A8H6L2T1_9LECA|nr:uncharacterized protein HO173_008347 [Letharia columbiana]KAF6233415.1 hypothetical protein HO173_008347 [Letharia columbiana]